MQKLTLGAMAVAALMLFAPLSAIEGQTNTEPVIAPAPRTVNLTAEQRFIIKEIVYKDLNVPRAGLERRNQLATRFLPTSSSMT
jgi:hypothetical protein